MTICTRILIVDDDKTMCQIMQAEFQLSGLEHVDFTTSPKRALSLLETNNDIGIVLTDVKMPEMDGIELTRTIKTRFPHIAVFVMTSFGSMETAIEAMRAGAYDFIPRPVETEYLHMALRRCLKSLEDSGLVALLSGRIFLSYARQDVVKVEDAYRTLRRAGFNPWMDTRDLTPGELWEQSITNAIREAAFFFAFISKSSMNRRGMLQKEIRTALKVWEQLLDSDIYLIPIRLEDCEVPQPLGQFQWVDLFYEDGWPKLFAAIRTGLRQRADR